MQTTPRGFTFIEVMIALVIAAILAAIAIPTYRNHVLRSQRTDATTALLQIQAAQEKHFLQYNRYASDLTGPPASGGLGFAALSEGGHYALGLIDVNASGTAYTARAVPRAGQNDDHKCRELTVNHNGTRAATDGSVDRTADCWR